MTDLEMMVSGALMGEIMEDIAKDLVETKLSSFIRKPVDYWRESYSFFPTS